MLRPAVVVSTEERTAALKRAHFKQSVMA